MRRALLAWARLSQTSRKLEASIAARNKLSKVHVVWGEGGGILSSLLCGLTPSMPQRRHLTTWRRFTVTRNHSLNRLVFGLRRKYFLALKNIVVGTRWAFLELWQGRRGRRGRGRGGKWIYFSSWNRRRIACENAVGQLRTNRHLKRCWSVWLLHIKVPLILQPPDLFSQP